MTNFWGMLYSLNLSFPNVQHKVFRIVPCLSLNVNATQVNTCFVTEQCELVITAEASSLPLSYSVPMCGSRPCPQLSALRSSSRWGSDVAGHDMAQVKGEGRTSCTSMSHLHPAVAHARLSLKGWLSLCLEQHETGNNCTLTQ